MERRKSYEIRKEARLTIKGSTGKFVGATAIMFVLSVITNIIFKLPVLHWVGFLAGLITIPLLYGWSNVMLQSTIGEKKTTLVFSKFKSGYWRSIGTQILFSIGIAISAIPAMSVAVVLFINIHTGNQGIITMLFIVFLVCLILPLMFIYFHSMVIYISLDRRDIGVWDTFKYSRRIMRGNCWRLFRLQITFFWWCLLCPFTIGILYLWILPYIQVSDAIFYRDITAEYESTGMGK